MSFSILYVFIAAFLVRLIGITQSLWLDEATTANVVKHLDYFDIVAKFSPTDFHPPLYYLFMHFWTSIFGYSEIALRMPSILFSLIAGWFVYRIALKLSNKTVAFWSCVFFLFNPLITYYSQEARMYMMTVMWLTLALYLYVDIVRDKMRSHFDIAVINYVFGFALATFYGSIFFIGSMYAYMLYKKKFRLLAIMLPGTIVALVMLSPLVLGQMAHARIALAQISHWNLALGLPNVKNLLLIPLKFVTGRISFNPKILYFALAGVSTIAITFFTVKGSQKNKWLAILLVLPLVFAFAISFWLPMLQYFRYLYLIPVMALLLGFGSKHFVWEKAVIASIFFVFSGLYLFFPVFHREDWKSILTSVPDSAIVYMIPSATDPVQYYYADRKTKNLMELSSLDPKTKELYVIPYTAEIYGFNYRGILDTKKYTLKDQQDFNGVTLEYWVKK
jgi:4-amino-4-deoxy-L-arabinose transferase-like glycosyltransferase